MLWNIWPNFQIASVIPHVERRTLEIVRGEAWILRESLFVTSPVHRSARMPMEGQDIKNQPRPVGMKIIVRMY